MWLAGFEPANPNERLEKYALDRATDKSGYVPLIYTEECQP